MPNTLIDKLHTQLTPEARALLDAVVEHASTRNLRAFLVGGTVRDLLLDREALDGDISVEGDAVGLAQEVAEATTAKLAKTSEFGTATLKSGGFRLDLVTARSETYAKPGTLPKVRPSTIDDDLHRRDFTINAVAVELTGPARGDILDPTGGIPDLSAGLVRVIHDKSFQDDATRIIRAVRFATRFDFRIEESTLDLITRDRRFIDKVSGPRLRQEMTRVFAEEHSARALSQLRDLGVLRAIHPALDPNDQQLHVIHRVYQTTRSTGAFCALLALDTSSTNAIALITRLSFTRKQSEAVRAMPALRTLAPQLTHDLHPSELAKLLSPVPEAALLAYASIGDPTVALRIRDYLDRLRTVRPILRGDDIVNLGIERGPDIADILAHLRAARLDGKVTTREDEVHFVEAYLARELVGLD